MRKVAKAQWYAKHEGLVYGRILTCCPLNWGMAEDKAESVMQAAIDSCVFPLYEVEQGHTAITYDPDKMGRRRPVADWLGLMDRTRKLVVPAAGAAMAAIEAETGRRWARLQAMHAHPLL
jgi:pyruvate ferredoxin oxidoreductase alpha subunit